MFTVNALFWITTDPSVFSTVTLYNPIASPVNGSEQTSLVPPVIVPGTVFTVEPFCYRDGCTGPIVSTDNRLLSRLPCFTPKEGVILVKVGPLPGVRTVKALFLVNEDPSMLRIVRLYIPDLAPESGKVLRIFVFVRLVMIPGRFVVLLTSENASTISKCGFRR